LVWQSKDCQLTFEGKEAVEWLLAHKVVPNRQKALLLANALLREGVLESINQQPKFEDDLTYYRFLVSEIDNIEHY
jgi:hypothetical protein